MDIEGIINLNLKSKESDIKHVYLYVFEQFLLMYRYAVINYCGDRKKTESFIQRMRFTGAVKEKWQPSYRDQEADKAKDREKLSYVLQLLDSGMKALDILAEIKLEGSPLSSYEVELVERAMEENSIIFPKSFDEHPYSFESMHSVLSNPLPILQRFLCLPHPNKLIELVVQHRLSEKMSNIDKNRRLSDMFYYERKPLNLGVIVQIHNNSEFTLDVLLEACSDGKITIIEKDFSEEIEKSIDELLQDWAAWVIDVTFPDHKKNPPIIDSLITSDTLKQNGSLSIHPKELEKLCMLGQAEQIGNMIARRIKSHYLISEGEKNDILYQEFLPLKQLAKWFRKCKTGVISEVSQMPAHIATLLYQRINDAEFINYLTCSKEQALPLSDKNRVEEIQQLVTELIHKHLFYNNESYGLPTKCTRSINGDLVEISSVDSYLKSNSELAGKELLNNIMSDWAIYDKKKTRDRFKRPWKAFRDDLSTTKSKVKRQQQTSIHYPFPITNLYPFPFWVITK